MTSMITWRAQGGQGIEGVRVLRGPGHGFRALGRLVRTGPGAPSTASYRLVVGEDGRLQRLSVTSATAERERHLTINRTDDGFWLLDTGAGGMRSDFGGAADVDLEHSPLFNTLPIRRLALHRQPGDHLLKVVFVTLPALEVQLVDQRYRSVTPLPEGGDEAVVGFRWDDFAADLVVDGDAVVRTYPGLAERVPTPAASTV
jgi:uncharacterized protein